MYSNRRNSEKTYQYITCYNPQIQGKEIIFFRDIPRHDDSLMIVTEISAIYVKWFSSNDAIHSFDKQERAHVVNDKVTYVCAAVTCDGKYLIVADSRGFINVFKTNIGFHAIATYRGQVISLDTYWLKENKCHFVRTLLPLLVQSYLKFNLKLHSWD